MSRSYEDSMALVRWWRSLQIAFARTFRPMRAGFREPLFPHNLAFRLICMAVIGLIIASMAYWDGDIIRFVRQYRHDIPGLHQFFETLTLLGESQWVLVGALIIGIPLSLSRWWLYPRMKRLKRIDLYADLNFAFFSVAITGMLASLIKNSIGRARPRHLDTLGEFHFELGAFQSAFASFPSGHSTTFGATCMMLALLVPRFRWLWLVVAVLGGTSRVVVGAHYLSDAIAGLAFGAGLTLLAARWLAQRGTMFRFNKTALPDRKRN